MEHVQTFIEKGLVSIILRAGTSFRVLLVTNNHVAGHLTEEDISDPNFSAFVRWGLFEPHAIENLDLIVAFVGAQTFDTGIAYLKNMKELNPRAVVVVVACPCTEKCNGEKAESALSGVADFVVDGHHYLGNDAAMGMILTSLRDYWSKRTASEPQSSNRKEVNPALRA